MGMFGTGGVAIKAHCAGRWKKFVGKFFEFLCAQAKTANGVTLALGTFFRWRTVVITIMAFESLIAAVIGQTHGTERAVQGFATAAAEHSGRIAPAVEQQNDLFFAFERLFNGQLKWRAKGRGLALVIAHIHHTDRRQRL